MYNSEWVRHFYRLFFNDDVDKRNEGCQLLQENRPKIFCKYLKPKYAEQFIKNQAHWFAHPKIYSDKFDGRWYRFPISESYNEEERRIVTEFQNLSINDEKNVLRSTLKLCSFTTNPLNLDMWCNYADNSKGICVEYDATWNKTWWGYSQPYLYERLYPMIYLDEPADLSDFVINGDNEGWTHPVNGRMFLWYFGILISLLKSSEYHVEDEWRAFFFEPFIGNPMYDEDEDEVVDPLQYGVYYPDYTNPKNIYLGENIEDNLKDDMLKYTNYLCTNLYQVNNVNGKLLCTLLPNPETS